MSVALITGIAGQDGTYLAQWLLEQGYAVHGVVRASPAQSLLRHPSLRGRVTLHQGDLRDAASVLRVLQRVQPREVYNLAAQSFVPASWEDPVEVANVAALGVARLLEAIRHVDPKIRLFQASTSEVFGTAPYEPQNEHTPFNPRTPYAAAKAYAHALCVSYRHQYGMFTACGILFNHESPLRDPRFVFRKVTQGAVAIQRRRAEKLRLGNLDARRDWGFAGDYVRAMHGMLRQPQGDDYVIATGQTHSVRELVDLAFRRLDLDWREHVEVDPELVRAEGAVAPRGDRSKAQRELGWTPFVTFEQLVNLMIDAELESMS